MLVGLSSVDCWGAGPFLGYRDLQNQNERLPKSANSWNISVLVRKACRVLGVLVFAAAAKRRRRRPIFFFPSQKEVFYGLFLFTTRAIATYRDSTMDTATNAGARIYPEAPVGETCPRFRDLRHVVKLAYSICRSINRKRIPIV